jgi:hypothetical protein
LLTNLATCDGDLQSICHCPHFLRFCAYPVRERCHATAELHKTELDARVLHRFRGEMMDTVTGAIVEAVKAGLHTAGPKLLEKTASEAYTYLKDLLRKKLGAKHDVHEAVTALEKQASPGRTAVLSEEIAKTNVPHDAEMNAAARALIEALRSIQPHSSNTQTATGSNIAQANDHSTATVTVSGTNPAKQAK